MAYTKKTNKPVVTETVVSPVETVTPVVETVVEEVKPREYKFMRQSVYQLQTTEKFYHDDDSDESETP